MRPLLRKRILRLTGGADAARASLTKPCRETEALDLQGQKKPMAVAYRNRKASVMLLFCSETGEADLVLVLGVRCSLPPLPPPSSSLETPPSAICSPRTSVQRWAAFSDRIGGDKGGASTVRERFERAGEFGAGWHRVRESCPHVQVRRPVWLTIG